MQAQTWKKWGPEGWGAQNFTPKAAGVSHESPRAQCTFEGPGLQSHHQNSTRRSPRKRRKNENCGGRGEKKSEILGGPAEGGVRRRGVWRRGWNRGRGPAEGSRIGERPYLGRTHEHFEHAPTHHTTTGGPAQVLGKGVSMAQKTRHEQQIVPKSSPIGQGFLGVKDGSQRFGHKTVHEKKERAKSGVGQKLCGPKS